MNLLYLALASSSGHEARGGVYVGNTTEDFIYALRNAWSKYNVHFIKLSAFF